MSEIKSNIEAYKRKFYLNRLIKGLLFSGIIFTSIFLIFSGLEGVLWFGKAVRMSFLIVLLAILLTALVWGVIIPVFLLLKIMNGITDEEAARKVGKFFPEIEDKLLNYLQLNSISGNEQSLINAALKQKTEQLNPFKFNHAVKLKPNLRYVYIFVSIIIVFTLVSFISPGFLSEGSSRILQFNREFEKPAPFSFHVKSGLKAFRNEAFELNVEIEGEYLPDEVYLIENGRKIRLNKYKNSSFGFTYPSISNDKDFTLEAAGYSSKTFRISVYDRPEIVGFEIEVDFPNYTGIRDKVIRNTGSLVVPEGSLLTWKLKTSKTDSIYFLTEKSTKSFSAANLGQFRFEKYVMNPFQYEIQLKNQFADNKSNIRYEVSIIKDQYPDIDADFLADTITYKSIFMSGTINDDYGFTNLSLYFKHENENDFQKIKLPFDHLKNNQQYFYEWKIDSLQKKNTGLQFYVSVRDNDVVNGFKESNSQKFYYNIPDAEQLKKMLEDASKNTKSQFEEAESVSETLNDKLQELEDRLKNKKELSWQEEKLLEEVLKEKKELQESIEELKEKHEELMRRQKEFGKQSEKTEKKSEELQELINESLDDETKELYEELQKLLEKKEGSEQILDKLSQVKSKERNLEKELERMKELFNRLQFEFKLEETTKELEETSEKQEKLSEKTEGLEEQDSKERKEEKKDEIQKEQDEINKKFDEIKKDIEEAEKLNEKLKSPKEFQDIKKEEEEIDEKQNEIQENLKNGKMNKAAQQQKNAAGKMKKMASSMQSMMSSMEMMMMQENIDQLRDILDNLIKLSMEEEKLIHEFQGVQQIDPRFIELSQMQLKLMDNGKVIEDSLRALASRVVKISNFITREVSAINENLENAMKELRERNRGKATSHQQFAMTSMNNLALLLDDVLTQMQMSMADMMGNPKQNGKGEKPMPGMSELQKELSEQIQDLKKSGKSGRKLSEELAKLAAEQAELRRQMESMQEKLSGQDALKEDGEKGGGGNNLKEAIEMMEENEIDLVNKHLSQELIERQQKIITRMLEAEESMRQQKESPEREGETATQNMRRIPPQFEEYLKAKQSELELLKTIPLDLNPFYKKEVNEYFRRLSSDSKP